MKILNHAGAVCEVAKTTIDLYEFSTVLGINSSLSWGFTGLHQNRTGLETIYMVHFEVPKCCKDQYWLVDEYLSVRIVSYSSTRIFS